MAQTISEVFGGPDSISDLDEVLQLMEEQRFVSEVGLDRRAASEKGSYQLQVEVFTRILETAEKHSNVLIVHSRGLEREMVTCWLNQHVPNRKTSGLSDCVGMSTRVTR